MKQRDPLELVHDLAETAILLGILVAIAAYAARNGDPLEAFSRHAGVAEQAAGVWPR